MAEELGYFRGLNGIIHEFRLPLPPVMQSQVDKRQLTPCDAEGNLLGHALPRPKDYDPKPKWVGFAVSKGVDPEMAESMTKNDLIGMFPDQSGEA